MLLLLLPDQLLLLLLELLLLILDLGKTLVCFVLGLLLGLLPLVLGDRSVESHGNPRVGLDDHPRLRGVL